MPNLGGFEVVGELTVGVLNQILQGAWDNEVIPHSTNVAAGTAFGPYALSDGVFNVPRAGVSLTMDTGINGVDVTLAGNVQAHVANPPVASVGFWDLQVVVTARVPIGIMPDTDIQVGALLNDIPRSSVSAALPGGNPVPALTLSAVAEYVHQQYQSGAIHSFYAQPRVSFLGYTADAWLDVYDDLSKPNHHITVSDAGAGNIKISIPVHLKLSNITGGAITAPSPMGVVASLTLTTPLTTPTGFIRAPIKTQGTISIDGFAPAPASDPEVGDFDSEGANYSLAAGFFPGLEAALKTQLQARAQEVVNAIGDIQIVVPTQSQIESFIADQAWKAIKGRGNIGLWTPTPPPGGDVTITSVKPLALADAIAFCLNNPNGDTGVIVNFIPGGRSCAIAIDGAKVLQIVQDQIHRPESEGGFGASFPPKTFHDVNGHDARLTSLSISLIPGSIHIEGDVTVIDAIADSIDVDASFSAEAGIQWKDNADGTQMIEPFTIGEPDVDLSVLAWILSFLLGFITLGLIGGIIALVVMAVATSVASQVGGAIIKDDVTGQIKGIGAWPQNLEGIGTVTARFENPIEIDPSGITFGDAYHVVATFASVTDALAHATGPAIIPEGALVELDGGPPKPHTSYAWSLGDGATATGPKVTHRYADNGVYIAKLTTVVVEKGGATTRHFAAVRVKNVAATVDAGAPITIDEGDVTEVVATFTDPGWADTHRAIFDFGDDSSPVEAPVTETHTTPLGRGTTSASHAYCDNGTYTVTVRVIDKDGGVGVGRKIIHVRNVAPTVHAEPLMFAYQCTPLTLVARFTDPGWCDTHTASWHFGDCSPAIPATVRERNDPPAGCGIAAATHRYDTCGDFLAVCTVVDDDGGVGQGATLVRVVDLVNGGFEGGFHSHARGVVGNSWTPYAVTVLGGVALPATAVELAPEQYVVHDDGEHGQRSQRIGGTGTFRAGIYQRVGANIAWDYQATGWYHLRADAIGATCRLGIDRAGGTDPDAPSVVWISGRRAAAWSVLAVRCTATARAITVFLELDARPSTEKDAFTADRTVAFFDSLSLLPYPCPLGEAPPCTPDTPPERTCVDWKREQRPRVLGDTLAQDGFTFRSVDPSDPLRIVLFGPPAGQAKLAIPRKLLEVTPPFTADTVTAQVWAGTQQPIVMDAFDAAGTALGRATSSGASSPPAPETLEIDAAGIAALTFRGGGGEGTLIELCVARRGNPSSEHGHDGSGRVALVLPTSAVTPASGDCGCKKSR